MTTLLIPHSAFQDDSHTVAGASFKHLFRARRLAEGDELRVVDGQGSARSARVALVGRRSAELELGDSAPTHEPRRAVEIFVAAPKVGRASWMVEKLTEIGARAIHVWATERGPRRYGEANLVRLGRVAAAAVAQCERSRVPGIANRTWREGVELLGSFAHRWLLTPGAAAPPELGDAEEPLALLVGPEGGWTEDELAELAALPCRPVGLGPTVLRVETAAIVGAARALLG